MLYLLSLYGIISGYFAGFLGMGVGVFLMPFYLLLGVPYETAVDASLMAVFLSSLTSSVQHFKTGKIPVEPCLVMIIPGIICAIIGSFVLIKIISPVILMIIFAGIMFLNVDFFDFIKRKKVRPILPENINHKRFFPLYILIGVLTGFSASLLGIGGGIIIVPLLVRFARFPVKDAVISAVLVMVFTTLFGLSSAIVHWTLPFAIGGTTAIGAVIGCFLGSIALKYVKQEIISRLNHIFSFLLGTAMLFRALFY